MLIIDFDDWPQLTNKIKRTWFNS